MSGSAGRDGSPRIHSLALDPWDPRRPRLVMRARRQQVARPDEVRDSRPRDRRRRCGNRARLRTRKHNRISSQRTRDEGRLTPVGRGVRPRPRARRATARSTRSTRPTSAGLAWPGPTTSARAAAIRKPRRWFRTAPSTASPTGASSSPSTPAPARRTGAGIRK